MVDLIKAELKDAFDAIPKMRVKQLPKDTVQNMRSKAKDIRERLVNESA